MRSKGQISLNFGYRVDFNFLYQTLCVFSQIKDRKHIEQNFHSVDDHVPGVGLGGAGGSKTLAWGFAMAPHRLHILVDLLTLPQGPRGRGQKKSAVACPIYVSNSHTKIG